LPREATAEFKVRAHFSRLQRMIPLFPLGISAITIAFAYQLVSEEGFQFTAGDVLMFLMGALALIALNLIINALFARRPFVRADDHSLSFRSPGVLSTSYTWDEVRRIELLYDATLNPPSHAFAVRGDAGRPDSVMKLLHFSMPAETILRNLQQIAPSEIRFVSEEPPDRPLFQQ
jgi:hypothetical protein